MTPQTKLTGEETRKSSYKSGTARNLYVHSETLGDRFETRRSILKRVLNHLEDLSQLTNQQADQELAGCEMI